LLQISVWKTAVCRGRSAASWFPGHHALCYVVFVKKTVKKRYFVGIWVEFILKRNRYLVKKEQKYKIFEGIPAVCEAVFINSPTASIGSLPVKILAL
jgi:hypothetical protein